jgi:hypothetical protein
MKVVFVIGKGVLQFVTSCIIFLLFLDTYWYVGVGYVESQLNPMGIDRGVCSFRFPFVANTNGTG